MVAYTGNGTESTSFLAGAMKFALLGVDADMLAVARAAVDSHAHELVWIHADDQAAAAVASFAFHVPLSRDWETLIAGQVADVVLVARSDNEDLLADQLRKLVQAGVPLIVSHPILESMLVCYELDMIRQDSRSPILPYRPWRLHPAVERLRAHVSPTGDAALGNFEQLTIERQLSDRRDRCVLMQFARDVDLARHLSGELTKLSAMSPPSSNQRLANLGVQLSGPNGALVRWSVKPVEDRAGARFTLLGTRGRSTLLVPDDDTPWSIETVVDGQATVEQFPDARPAAVFVNQLESAWRAAEADSTDWLAAARAVELAETIDRSLAKGRTIELYDEDYSEETTFKGTMAALGCGVLLVALFGLLLSALITGLGIPLLGAWPYALLAILAVFLLLQAFRFVFPRDR